MAMPSLQRTAGFSLVELLVGLAVGLLVAAAASQMLVTQVGEHRRMGLEAQVQQELRAVGDLMQRDLRRAGFRSSPQDHVWAADAPAPKTNPYVAVDVFNGAERAAAGAVGSRVEYSYPRHDDHSAVPHAPEDDVVTDDERFGFRLNEQVLEFLVGGRWQALTDPATSLITRFEVRLIEQPVPLTGLCDGACPGAMGCQVVRRLDMVLEAQAAHDTQVRRRMALSTRVRSDQTLASGSGACP